MGKNVFAVFASRMKHSREMKKNFQRVPPLSRNLWLTNNICLSKASKRVGLRQGWARCCGGEGASFWQEVSLGSVWGGLV